MERSDVSLRATQDDAAPTRVSYMVMFAQQRRVNLPNYAHSFAAFVHGDLVGGAQTLTNQETFVISWLPRSMRVRFFGSPEPGHNLTLANTFDYAGCCQSFVAAWGPFRVRNVFLEKARQRYHQLEEGRTQYVVLDNNLRPFDATNCIHALSDLGLSEKLLKTGTAYGIRASRRVLRHYTPWIMDPCRTHPWVAEALGLGSYPIEYQEVEAGDSALAALCQPVRWMRRILQPRVRYT